MAIGVNIQWGYAGLFSTGIVGSVALGGLAVVLVSAKPVPRGPGPRAAAHPGALLFAVAGGGAWPSGCRRLPAGRGRALAHALFWCGLLHLPRPP
jgi:branched-chain amino acid transport system permease protein